MSARTTMSQLLRQSFESKKSSTNTSLFDLSLLYYGGKVSTTDATRAWLQGQTGLTTTQSLNDLWRQFFLGKGVANQVSLSDMAQNYFNFQALP